LAHPGLPHYTDGAHAARGFTSYRALSERAEREETMRIEADFSDEETTLLLLILGAGIGILSADTMINDTNRMLTLVNRLMANNPNFIPYTFTGESDLGE
jgi:hypothetical protein